MTKDKRTPNGFMSTGRSSWIENEEEAEDGDTAYDRDLGDGDDEYDDESSSMEERTEIYELNECSIR